ncbi:MAG TPA: class I SAM-dependent methyltransferase, partial [Rhizomicrobium sp.]
IDIARNLVEAGNRRAQALKLNNIRFQEGDASHLDGIADNSFDLTVTIFGAMFAPRPFDVAKEMVRVTKPGGRVVMGNWIPGDPTLVAQILKIASNYVPPPPPGFVSPMTWGMEDHVIERFGAAGVPKENIAFFRDMIRFEYAGSPADYLKQFRTFYGPTITAFEAAQNAGKEAEMQRDMENLFNRVNESKTGATSIPATFLRVTATVP